jgi:hypothetical protein
VSAAKVKTKPKKSRAVTLGGLTKVVQPELKFPPDQKVPPELLERITALVLKELLTPPKPAPIPDDLQKRIAEYVEVREQIKELEAVRAALNSYFLNLAGNKPAEFASATHRIVIDRDGRRQIDIDKVILEYGRPALSKVFTQKTWLYVTAKEIEVEGGPEPSKR